MSMKDSWEKQSLKAAMPFLEHRPVSSVEELDEIRGETAPDSRIRALTRMKHWMSINNQQCLPHISSKITRAQTREEEVSNIGKCMGAARHRTGQGLMCF